jgi:hypothetical protein
MHWRNPITIEGVDDTIKMTNTTLKYWVSTDMQDLGANAWADTVDRYIGKAWQGAAKTHFESDVPHAYKETKAIRSPSIVANKKWFKVGILGDVVIQPVEIYISGKSIPADHAKAANMGTSITHLGALEIRWSMDNEHLVYPFTTEPDAISLGVIGSWWQRLHPKDYLMDYIFAGPNAKDQPAIYRKLGGSGRRVHEKGLDLLNNFFAVLGIQQISKLPDSGTKRIDGMLDQKTQGGHDTILGKWVREMADHFNEYTRNNKFSGVMGFDHDLPLDPMPEIGQARMGPFPVSKGGK